MTNDNTRVETDELRRWSRDTHARGDEVARVADDVGRVDVGLDTFGLIHRVFCGDFIDRLQATLDKARDTAGHLETDSRDATAVADSFDDVDEAQADRFKGSDGRG